MWFSETKLLNLIPRVEIKQLVGPRLAFALPNRLVIDDILDHELIDVQFIVVESDNKVEFWWQNCSHFGLSYTKSGADTNTVQKNVDITQQSWNKNLTKDDTNTVQKNVDITQQSWNENLTKDDTNHITNYVHSFLTLMNYEDDLIKNGRLPKCKMTQQKRKATETFSQASK